MKRENIFLAILVAVCMAVGSCTKEASKVEDLTSGNPQVCCASTGYVIYGYYGGMDVVGAKDIHCFNSVYGKMPDNTLLPLYLTVKDQDSVKFINSGIHKDNQSSEYIELAEKYGEFGTFEKNTPIAKNRTFMQGITDLRIWAVNDYNDNYLAGSELSDMATITYSSFEPFISNNFEDLPEMELSPLQEGGIPMISDTYSEFAYPYYNTELPRDGKNPILLPSVDDAAIYLGQAMGEVYFANVSFKEAPTTTTPKFDIRLTFADGKVIQNTVEVDTKDYYY